VNAAAVLLAFQAQSSVVPAFDIPDQFGRRHTQADLRGDAGLIVMADRGCAGSIRDWTLAIRQALPDPKQFGRVRRLAVVDLRAVPILFRPLVLSRFPTDTAQVVGLDWEGTLAQAFNLRPGGCLAIVVDAAGRVVETGGGAAISAVEVRRLAAALWRVVSVRP
jgi:hypothetical protein